MVTRDTSDRPPGDGERPSDAEEPMRLGLVTSAIYGTVVVTAVMATIPEQSHPGRGLLWLFGTLIVFWLTHVYAASLAMRFHHRRPPTVAEVVHVAREEAPLLSAATPPALLLLLCLLGVMSRPHAYDLSMVSGVAVLFAWGVIFARREGAAWTGWLWTGFGTALLGLIVVLLEVTIE